MDTSTKVILIAMSVLVTVGLISLAAFNFGMASSTVKTMSNSLTEQSNEWDMSSLASLDGKKLTGSEVASVIRKYKKEYVCRVETVKGGLKDYTSMSAFVNSVDDVNNYINPESLFNCSLQFQGSSISRLEFREISASVDSIVSADDAKVFLADNTTQVNNAMGWLEIAEVIKAQDSSGANESKDILAAALGYNASNKSLKDLANEAKGRIENLEQTLEESKDAESVNVSNNSSEIKKLMPKNDYNGNDSKIFNLNNTPRFVLAYDIGSGNLQMLSEVVSTSSVDPNNPNKVTGAGWTSQSGTSIIANKVWCNYTYESSGSGYKLTINNVSQKTLLIIVLT